MFGIDNLLGGALQAIPGANMAGIIGKGIELLKGLLESKDLKGAEDVVNLLSKFMQQKQEPGGTSPCEPQPFTPPPSQSQNLPDGSKIEIEVRISAPRGEAVPHEPLPFVDGSAQGDQNLSNQASKFMEGSDANKARALQPGSQEWTSVMWAMQSNPNVCYNADTQRFFAKTSDGGKMDLGSLKDVQSTIEQNGGYNRGNPTAFPKVGELMNSKLQQAQSEPQVNSIVYRITTQASKATETSDNGDAAPEPTDVPSRKRDHRIAELEQQVRDYSAARIVMRSQEFSYTSHGVSA